MINIIVKCIWWNEKNELSKENITENEIQYNILLFIFRIFTQFIFKVEGKDYFHVGKLIYMPRNKLFIFVEFSQEILVFISNSQKMKNRYYHWKKDCYLEHDPLLSEYIKTES